MQCMEYGPSTDCKSQVLSRKHYLGGGWDSVEHIHLTSPLSFTGRPSMAAVMESRRLKQVRLKGIWWGEWWMSGEHDLYRKLQHQFLFDSNTSLSIAYRVCFSHILGPLCTSEMNIQYMYHSTSSLQEGAACNMETRCRGDT